MTLQAYGLAYAMTLIPNGDHRFNIYDTGTLVANQIESGEWEVQDPGSDPVDPGDHFVNWDGPDVSVTNDSGSTHTIDALGISYIGGFGTTVDRRLARIPHSGITLNDGDIITYTEIIINFYTEDV